MCYSEIIRGQVLSRYYIMQKAVTIGLTLSLLAVVSCQRHSATSEHYKTNGDSCSPYNPPVPDFRSPGRRLSLTKCYEYIWEIKVRLDKAKKSKACNTIAIHLESKREVVEESLEDNDNDTIYERPTHQLHATKYIIRGHDAIPAEFPHMGAVGWESIEGERVWKFQCGCTLISHKFALSAAHCSVGDPRDTTIADVNPKIIRFGVEDLVELTLGDRQPIDRLITKTIVHPQYASPKKYFDLALFELNEEITFNHYVQPACLWNGGVDDLKDTTISGWGVTEEGSHKTAPFLQVASLGTIDFNTCDLLLKPRCNRLWCGLQDHQFCAGQLSGGADSCQGDSGGPLQMKIPLPPESKESIYYVIGVTSFGFGCGRADLPGVYTKVPHFLDWIESVVWP